MHVLKPLHTGVALSEQKVLEFRLSTPMIQSVLSVNECVCAYSMYIGIPLCLYKHCPCDPRAFHISQGFVFCKQQLRKQGRRNLGGRGGHNGAITPHILTDESTISQSVADYAHHITIYYSTQSPGFSDLPTALQTEYDLCTALSLSQL